MLCQNIDPDKGYFEGMVLYPYTVEINNEKSIAVPAGELWAKLFHEHMNTRLEQDGHQFADDFSNSLRWMKLFFRFEFHWGLFLRCGD